MAETPVLETKKLGITFGGLKAVQDFNIQIYTGELVGLIGPNGAGKTTVFNMLTGVYVPTEGTVLLDGVPLNGRKTHQFVAAGVARTFQNIRLFREMSVIDNVRAAFTKDTRYNMIDATFRTPKFWKIEEELTSKALDLLAIFHLEDKAEWMAANLPYGQQRKLEIARALATNMIKETSIASLLPIIELMKLGNQIYAKTYHPFEIFITIAVVYFLMTYFVTILSRWAERRLAVWAN